MKIAIGGMIASGKSTLVKNLSKKLGYDRMDEYTNGDEVFETLLKWLYEGKQDVEMLLQIYFLHKHWTTQALYGGDVVVDRDIIEHWIFAQENIKDKPEILNMYNAVFHAYMNTHRKPDLYIILDMNWGTFEERITKRGRSQEVDNFDENAVYFLNLLRIYVEKIKAQCAIYNIPYTIIKVDGLSEQEVLEQAYLYVKYFEKSIENYGEWLVWV